MNTIAAECPVCHTTNQYDPDTMGKYPTCPDCGARFYVTVPPLVESEGRIVIASPDILPAPKTHAIPEDVAENSDPLHVMRLLGRLTWLVIALLVLVLVNLAVTASFLIQWR